MRASLYRDPGVESKPKLPRFSSKGEDMVELSPHRGRQEVDDDASRWARM